MAQFYGQIKGNRGMASRMGSKEHGFWGHIRGWNVGCRVECFYDEKTDSDMLKVYRTGGSNGGSEVLIATLYEDGRVMFEQAIEGEFGIRFEKDPNVKTLKRGE